MMFEMAAISDSVYSSCLMMPVPLYINIIDKLVLCGRCYYKWESVLIISHQHGYSTWYRHYTVTLWLQCLANHTTCWHCVCDERPIISHVDTVSAMNGQSYQMLTLCLRWSANHTTCWHCVCDDLSIIPHVDSMAAMIWPSYHILTLWLQWSDHHITCWLYGFNDLTIISHVDSMSVMLCQSYHMVTLCLWWPANYTTCWLYICNVLPIIPHIDTMSANPDDLPIISHVDYTFAMSCQSYHILTLWLQWPAKHITCLQCSAIISHVDTMFAMTFQSYDMLTHCIGCCIHNGIRMIVLTL